MFFVVVFPLPFFRFPLVPRRVVARLFAVEGDVTRVTPLALVFVMSTARKRTDAPYRMM